VRDGLRQFDALPHAFAVGGHGTVGGFGHGDALERFRVSLSASEAIMPCTSRNE
jgi:hypothetical protein